MRVDLIPLKRWIATHFENYPDTPPKQQKEEVASDIGCGVATLYRWLKDGDVYIESVGASMAGDDSGIVVWHMKKSIFE